MKILTIPDIHCKSIWKKFSDLKMLWQFENIATEYDYYVFIGDFTDSYADNNKQMYNNLVEIIELKKKYPKQVILLLGNHDLTYMFQYRDHECSGFRPEMYKDLHKVFNDNKDLFQASFQIDNYVWTHAGISKWWFSVFEKESKNKNVYKYQEDLTISENLNKAFLENEFGLYLVGKIRGGHCHTGGIFWCDKSEITVFHNPTLQMYPIKGYNQIVGHSRSKLETLKFDENTSITFTDCLDKSEDLYILNI